MARTSFTDEPKQEQPAQPQSSRRNFPPPAPADRTLREDVHYSIRCHWPCPCGGTVPDAPEHCQFRRFQSKAGTYCVDVGCCVQHCGDNCEAYQKFTKLMKRRRELDNLNSMLKEQQRGKD